MNENKKLTEEEVGIFIRDNVLTLEEEDHPDGWFNSFFETEPTLAQRDEYILRQWTARNKQADEKKRLRINRILKEMDPSLVKSQIITMQFNRQLHEELKQPETFTKGLAEIYVNEFKKANYKWLSNGKMTFEFYSKTGFNPHIHIYCETGNTPGQTYQALKRKFSFSKKWRIYNINVTPGNAEYQEKYVLERYEKQESKQVYTEQDKVLRVKNGIQHSYDI